MIMLQGAFEASTRGDANDSLSEQHLDNRLALTKFLWTAMRVHMAVILSVDEALRNLGTFDFVALRLFSAGRRYSPDIMELFCLVERL